MSLRALFRGWIGEAQSRLAQKLFLDSKTYIQLDDVTIPTSNGTTQIDHVIISRHGVFVIETKNMAGWIFGSEKSPQWTQSIFGKKFKFQNPLHQNYRHTRALSELLAVPLECFFSVVMFWGDCEFKTPMPPNVMMKGYISYIKSRKELLLSDRQVKEIVATINADMLEKSRDTRRKHVAALRERFSSTTTCPKCGGQLVLRTARAPTSGRSKFYGCSKFPACRYIVKVEPPT